jgi:Flp pilus assembly protein TadG
MKRQAASWSKRVEHRLTDDGHGAVLVEAAIVLPIVIALLLGIVTYAAWFMAAHSLQEAANDAARAALAGVDGEERQQLVDESIAKSVVNTGTLNSDFVTVTTAQDDAYYSVSLRYEAGQSALFSHALIPLPADTILRTAVVQLSSP